MKPDKTSVYDLFYNQRRFAVPLYQRPYVWSLEAQWQPLWQDIDDKAHAVLQRQTDVPHFLGAIVTGQRPVFGNRISSWDIIDGQQRLTTLQIILKAFRDVMNVQAGKESKYDFDLKRITVNEGLMEGPDEQFKVWPTNSDRAVFRSVMTAGAIDKVIAEFPAVRGRRRRPAPKLAEAYVFFFRAMERFLAGADDVATTTDARSDALFETFRRYLQVVNIELEPGDDPQVIFESLNGRGVALLPSDLVRNLVFMRAASSAPVDADTLYGNYWKQYDEARFGSSIDAGPWWKEEERQGRLKRPRLDLFLFYYVQYRTEQEVHIGHLFQEFRKWWEHSAAKDAAGALAEMRRYADAFRSWLEPDGFERVDEFSRWLSALDTATVYPLLFLLLVEQSGSTVEDRDGMLADLESYLVRRAICGLTNKGYNRFFMALMRKLRASNSVNRTALRAELMAGKGDSSRWPTDEEFGRAFIHRPAYQVIRRPVIAKLLDSLERVMVDKVNDEIEIKGKLSIEHVMPQEWGSHWPLAESSDDAVEHRELMLQTLGNLTLVTPEFNTKLSNRDFKTKKKEIKRTSRLLLNRLFWEDELQDWDEASIRLRSRELFDLARRRWPHPTSPATLEGLALDLPPDKSGRISDDEDVIDEPPIEPSVAESLLEEFAQARNATAQAIHD
jgi:hypothetical protein